MTAAHVFTDDELARFWDKVSPSGDCWLWTASTNGKGYGTFGLIRTKTSYLAHRVTWELRNGVIPEGFTLDHSVCGTKRCVNPDHLEIVTRRVNTWRGAGLHWRRDYRDMLIRVALYPAADGLIRLNRVGDVMGTHPRILRRPLRDGELEQVVVNHNQRYVRKTDLIDFIVARAAEDAGLPVVQALINQQKDAA
ncbi:HNH endonuclease signature motif containing protein [Mycobacteroides abscessus]|uniref:HNH endonuclease signature motif containing protein n=1 Tax=Mycobacteroides abscessus TaxID=36809 RepID=UPI0005E36C4C|nr:HNH endonuclease signature motif containing protein [Mycobacteroides abscessus]CPW94761.1 HNH endonuclease [Mycobacteroides abscessus]